MLKGISSMATRQVLAELAAAWQAAGDEAITIESVGGVDAARRVQGGESFDLVFLAANAIDKLAAAGHVSAATVTPIVRSEVAVAVRAGTAYPAIDSEQALRQAVLAAPSIGYSTGPSGTALLQLFEQWGIASELQSRIVQATPGIPVGSLVARGEVALGFQQLSELLNLDGIDVVGTLPPPVQIVTIFSGAVAAGTQKAEVGRALLKFMASPGADAVKQRHGMARA